MASSGIRKVTMVLTAVWRLNLSHNEQRWWISDRIRIRGPTPKQLALR